MRLICTSNGDQVLTRLKTRSGCHCINPFTKEEVMFKAKPATTVIKVRPLKKLKDMAL